MSLPLKSYVDRFAMEGELLINDLKSPLLVWEPPDNEGEMALMTQVVMANAPRPKLGSPYVLEVRKASRKGNVFAMGITLGRVDTNDLVVHDNSVSRFHAYFQQGPDETWLLVDASSRNGTWVNRNKIPANRTHIVADGDFLKFGHVQFKLYMPPSFVSYLKNARLV